MATRTSAGRSRACLHESALDDRLEYPRSRLENAVCPGRADVLSAGQAQLVLTPAALFLVDSLDPADVDCATDRGRHS